MKNYRTENGIKIGMEYWKTLQDDIKIYIIEALDCFKYESDIMFENVIDEIYNAIRDGCSDITREGIEKYTLEYVNKNYSYNITN